jgi:hypothetical protein
LLRNVGLDDRKVRPRFQHLKQKVTLLLVRSFSRSSSAIEHLSQVVNCIGHWAHPLDFKPHRASAKSNAALASRFHKQASARLISSASLWLPAGFEDQPWFPKKRRPALDRVIATGRSEAQRSEKQPIKKYEGARLYFD